MMLFQYSAFSLQKFIYMAVMGHFLVKCYETTQNPPIGTDFRRLGLYIV
jgi:hypothetical protein